jgi:hypothetical protein
MRWGHLGIGIACGLLVLSYRGLPTHWGTPSGWVSLVIIGLLIYAFASWSGRDRSIDPATKKQPGKDLDLRR